MDSVYNKKFYEEFCGDNYDDVEIWSAFFGNVARNIVDIFAPKTVLDAGCAYGYLVKALRDLGVDAYGFDVSEFAISRADESIKPYVAVHSITEKLPSDFPKQFDLVITIEVLEHIFPDEGRKAIKNLCSYSDTVIFTSTPSDLNNKTHVNVQQAEYWAKEFAKNSFYRDPFQTADYICPWAIVFRKKSDIEDVIFNYEINRRVDKIQYDKALNNAGKRPAISGKLYFDCGGLREDNTVAISYSEGINLTSRVSVPHNCNAIRFDPVEDCGCVVSELVIGSSNGILQVQEGNYERFIDRCYYFLTPDPQLYIPLPNGTTWVEISCAVVVLENIFEQKMISELNAAIKYETEKNFALNQEKAELESGFNTERQRYEDEKNALAEKSESRIAELESSFNAERQRYEAEKNALVENSESRIAELENSFNAERQRYENEKNALVEKSESRIAELESSFNAERQRYEDEKNALIEKNKNDIDGLERDFDAERRQYEDERSALIALIEKRETDFEELKNSFDMERRQYERERLALTLKNESELESLTEKFDQSRKTNSDIQTELNNFKKNYNAVIGQKDDITQKFNQSQNNNAKIQAELNHYKAHYHSAIRQRNNLQSEVRYWQDSYNIISSSEFWRITKPARSILDGIKLLHRKSRESHLKRVEAKRLLKEKKFRDKYGAYNDIKAIAQSYDYLVPQRKTEEERKFTRKIKFSILVPLYNTPKQFLEEMIASVVAQTYQNWELCLADGSDDEHKEVGELVEKLAANDKRIRYKKLKSNLGISENTNACIDMARGNYIALFDHDDVLHPSALYEVMCRICDDNSDFIYTDEATFESPDLNKIITAHFKPDYAIDNLRANNYICHLSVFSKKVLNKAGKFRHEYDGSQDHDMVLRLTSAAKHIVHIPKLLYFWRSHPMSVAQDIGAKSYAIDAGKNAVKADINRGGYECVVESSRACPTIYRLKYEIFKKAKVSIIIPNKNHLEDLRKCVESILDLSTYRNYEVVIVDNGSDDTALFEYYEELKKDPRFVICSCDIPFNYSKLNNYGAAKATGEYYILLNNDIEIITPEWIEEMLMYAQRDDVGAAGALLLYPDNTVQHAGIVLGLGADRVAGHAFHRVPKANVGYMGRLCYAQDMSAVTAACMMVKASVYSEVNGFDEEAFEVSYNDVDFCMKIRSKGYLIVWTPYAEAYHYESKSRGYDSDPKQIRRFKREAACFREKWAEELKAGDPYYNPNFTLDKADFSTK